MRRRQGDHGVAATQKSISRSIVHVRLALVELKTRFKSSREKLDNDNTFSKRAFWSWSPIGRMKQCQMNFK
jgi:hypothetical protein